MRVYIFVIIPNRKFSILTIKTMSAENILFRCTNTVSSPVSERTCDSVQERIICINSAAFSHCHMMRWIKTGSSDISDRSGQFLFPVDRINRSKCITVIFDQPQIMTITEFSDCFQVKWISKCMRKHDRFCLWRPCRFQKRWINIVLWNRYINKYRYRTVLDHRRNCSRKTGRNCDHFIPRKNLPFFQKRRCQCHKCEQICRGTGIYQGTVTNTEIFCKCMFKFICITSCGQPEFKGTIHKIYHFFCIINSGRIRDTVTFLIWFLFVMVFFTIISCHFQNLLSGLLFCHFFKHNSLLLYFIFLYSTETFPHKKESSLLVHNDP